METSRFHCHRSKSGNFNRAQNKPEGLRAIPLYRNSKQEKSGGKKKRTEEKNRGKSEKKWPKSYSVLTVLMYVIRTVLDGEKGQPQHRSLLAEDNEGFADGKNGCSFAACLRRLTIDHASHSSTASIPNTDTSNPMVGRSLSFFFPMY